MSQNRGVFLELICLEDIELIDIIVGNRKKGEVKIERGEGGREGKKGREYILIR